MSKDIITQDELKSQLLYNPIDGLFTRLSVNKICGHIKKDGYVYVSLFGKDRLIHRLAWLYVHGDNPKYIDHINGNKSDNRICNLRECTTQQNSFNSKISSKNTSGHKNVYFENNRWRVYFRANKKKINYGSFSKLEDAVIVANEARIVLHKDFHRFK